MRALYLSRDWRILSDPLQWVLQVRKPCAKKGGDEWRSDGFYRRRNPLLDIIAERCGSVEPAAIEFIRSWPTLKPEGEDLPSPPKAVAERLDQCPPPEAVERDEGSSTRPRRDQRDTSTKDFGVWFDEGVPHRNVGQASWRERPLRFQFAIILSANLNKVDAWELVRPECQEAHLAESDRLIAEGVPGAASQDQVNGREVAAWE